MRPDLSGRGILLVGDWPPPLGGVSVHMHSLRAACRRAGARVHVIDIGKGQSDAPDVTRATTPATYLRSLAREANAHDTLHLHTNGANVKSWALVLATGLAARALGLHAVLTIHSGHAPTWLSSPQRVLYARLGLAHFDRLISVSSDIAHTLSRMGAWDHRGLIAPAFGPDGLEPGVLPSSAQSFSQNRKPLFSAMLGRGVDYGGLELLDAFSVLVTHLPNAGLVVYGEGCDDDFIRAHPALQTESVITLGSIPRTEALAVVRASDVFVRPSRVDGDAVSVREALALGTRVVATRVGTRPSSVTLCAPKDSSDLSRAMRVGLSSPRPTDVANDGIGLVLQAYKSLDSTPSETPKREAFQ